MTITWRGLGFLGFMLPLAFMAVATMIGGVNNVGGIRIAFVLSAIVVWIAGTRLNADGVLDDGRLPHLTFGQPLQYSAWLSVACLGLSFL